MICKNCGEENSSAFRFCGMCGTPLESQPPAPTVPVAAAQATPRIVETRRSEPRHVPVVNNVPPPPTKPQPAGPAGTIAGPSLLGLGQESDTKPDVETLRRKSFPGVDSFLEPEEQSTSGRRILLLLVLLIALGAAGWWTYSNYQGATRVARQAPSNPPVARTVPETPAAKPETAPAPAVSASTNPSQAGGAQTLPHQEPASAQPIDSNRPPDTQSGAKQRPLAAAAKPVVQLNGARPRTERVEKPVPAATLTAGAVGNGDSEYRKAEAFLYGRGIAENCDEAVKLLKAASAQQNAKARSTFGTMYATGHCVPRDLPTSYSWFALALRVDPNNQILEKDLNAIWSQMTPPERETATKSRQ